MKESQKTKPEKILIAAGSNLGSSMCTIKSAFELLEKTHIIDNISISNFYKSEPVGPKDQPWFVNACASGETYFDPALLLYLLKSAEYVFGRQKRRRWYMRELDLDIIFYGNRIIKKEKLKIPHPEMQRRKFVLVPSHDIIPDFIHPVYNKTVFELLDDYNGNEKIFKIE